MEVKREQNRETLLEAIRMLPGYEPPPQLWPEIRARLDEKTVLEAAIRELPQYAAPGGVWPRIEQNLDTQGRGPAGIRRFRRSLRRLAAAAIIGAAFLVWWQISTGSKQTISFAYAEAVITTPEVAPDWNAEDADFKMVLEQVERSPVADPAVVERLKLELDELTEARNEVAVMLQRYGKDEELLKEAARIERVRSRVIKEIAAWI